MINKYYFSYLEHVRQLIFEGKAEDPREIIKKATLFFLDFLISISEGLSPAGKPVTNPFVSP